MNARNSNNNGDSFQTAPSEMEIVDTFTRLILAGDEDLSVRDQSIIHALCLVDDNAAQCRADDYPREIGVYLRALGVSEMIRLVKQVQASYPVTAQTESASAEAQPARL